MQPVTNQRSRALYFAFAALALAAGGAAAQTYPDKPVKIISPFSAGGPADIYARYLGQRLEKPLGQPFVVENRVGGGGIIGTDPVAKSPPDGYTLLVMSNTHTVNESLVAKKPYKLMTDLVAGLPDQLLRPAAGRAPVGAGEEPEGAARRSRGRTRASSTTPRPDPGRRITWRASSSSRWRASTSCTCRTRRARAHGRA